MERALLRAQNAHLDALWKKREREILNAPPRVAALPPALPFHLAIQRATERLERKLATTALQRRNPGADHPVAMLADFVISLGASEATIAALKETYVPAKPQSDDILWLTRSAIDLSKVLRERASNLPGKENPLCSEIVEMKGDIDPLVVLQESRALREKIDHHFEIKK